MKILVCDPDKEWCNKTQTYLMSENFEIDIAFSGKDCQLKIFKEKYFALILDLYVTSHSALEVLKYVRLTRPSVRVILTSENDEVFKSMDMEKGDLLKLGASDILIKPFSNDQLLQSVNGTLQYQLMKNLIGGRQETESKPEDVMARDDEFTRIKISEFTPGNIAIFDIFIRIGERHFTRLLHAGDPFNKLLLKKYRDEKQIEYLFFKTKDRALYIHFINSMMEKVFSKKTKVSLKKKVDLIKNVTEKYVEEIYTSGLKPQLIEEGNKMCENMAVMIKKEKKLYSILQNFKNFDYSTYSHSFLVSFFASILCSNLEWASSATIEKIALGSILHDLGKLKLPPYCHNFERENMNKDQLKEYKKHPELGVEMLSNFAMINQSVTQIVLQHHEVLDGSGFPNGLTAMKIYPLAQVVSLVDEFAHVLTRNKLVPLEGLKLVLKDREFIMKHNQKYIKALISSFIKGKIEL